MERKNLSPYRLGWSSIFDEDIDAVDWLVDTLHSIRSIVKLVEGVPLVDGEVRFYMTYSIR